MIVVAVVCRNKVEKEAALDHYGRANCTVFGPEDEVRAECFVGGELASCGDCDVGAGAYLVVVKQQG